MAVFQGAKSVPIDFTVHSVRAPAFTKRFTIGLNVQAFSVLSEAHGSTFSSDAVSIPGIEGSWYLHLTISSPACTITLDRQSSSTMRKTGMRVTGTVQILSSGKMKSFNLLDYYLPVNISLMKHADLFDAQQKHIVGDCLRILADITLLGRYAAVPADQQAIEATNHNVNLHVSNDHTLGKELLTVNFKSYCDFTIVSSDNKEFAAHRLILAARSEVFRAMLKAGTSEAATGRCVMKDVDGEVLPPLLEYIYTGSVECSPEMAEKLLVVADKYGFVTLVDSCVARLIENMTRQNALRMLRFAEKYRLQKLADAVCQLIGVPVECMTD